MSRSAAGSTCHDSTATGRVSGVWAGDGTGRRYVSKLGIGR